MPLLSRKKNKKVPCAHPPGLMCPQCLPTQPAKPSAIKRIFGCGAKAAPKLYTGPPLGASWAAGGCFAAKPTYYRSKAWKPTPEPPACASPNAVLVNPAAGTAYMVPTTTLHPQTIFAPVSCARPIVSPIQYQQSLAIMPHWGSFVVVPQVHNGVWEPRDDRLPQQRITEII